MEDYLSIDSYVENNDNFLEPMQMYPDVIPEQVYWGNNYEIPSMASEIDLYNQPIPDQHYMMDNQFNGSDYLC